MKYLQIFKTVFLLIFLFTLNASVSAQGKYKIDGTVDGLTDGKIYLINGRSIDTIAVKNSRFQIEKTMNESVARLALVKTAEMRALNFKTMFTIFAEPVSMALELNYSDFSKSKLIGSKSQDDNSRYEAITNKIQTKYKKETDYFESVSKKYQEAVAAGKEEKTVEDIKNESDAAKEKLEPMFKEYRAATLQFIKDNPQSYASLSLFMSVLNDMKYDQAKSIYDGFNPLHTNTQAGKMLLSEIENMKKGVPGAKASDFNTVDVNGKPVKLADFKGQYLLIDFWASWCVPCRKGNPHLLKLYSIYKPKGLEILGVSDDDHTIDAWKKAIAKDEIGVWRHILRGLEYKKGTRDKINPEKDISDGYNISSLPTKLLINPQGVVIARYDGSAEDDKKMDEDLASIFGK